MCLMPDRAGFTLSRPCSEKNVGPFTWGGRPYFSWKTWRPFLVISVRVSAVSSPKTVDLFCSPLSFTQGSPIISRMQKFPAPFVGPLFGRTCWTCLNPPLIPELGLFIDHPRSCLAYNFGRVCPAVCLKDDNFRKPWCRKFIFAGPDSV